jgi:hypothetical protein
MPSPHLWRKASMAPGSLANPHRQHPIGPSSTHDRHAGIEREDHTIDLVGAFAIASTSSSRKVPFPVLARDATTLAGRFLVAAPPVGR